MSEPYYSDDLVTLYHGRAEDVLPNLQTSGDTHLITDPPYFKVKSEDWDNQWDKSADFLEWLGGILDAAKPLLSANGSVWVFTSPQLNTAVESVVASRFRVLNNVRWVKEQGWHQKADLGQARRFLTPWEGIIFAEQFGADGSALKGSGWNDATAKLWAGVFEPLRAYLVAERDAAGVTNRQIDAHLGTAGMARHYFGASQWTLPTANAFAAMSELVPFSRDYEDLRRDYEDLRRDYEDLRRTFEINKTRPSTDLWNFGTVSPYPGKHPCEKPHDLLDHIITTTTRPGDTIIDCFAGSGSTLQVARDLGRKSIGIEMDERWCERIATRLAQHSLDFGNLEDEVRATVGTTV